MVSELPLLDPTRCSACGQCVDVCPTQCLTAPSSVEEASDAAVRNALASLGRRTRSGMPAAVWFDCTPDDLVWCTAGTGWAKSLWNVLLGPWSSGSCIVVHEGGFIPEERMNLIRDLGVTVLCQAPTE